MLNPSRLEYFITPVQVAYQLGLDMDSLYQSADEGKHHAAISMDGTISISQQIVNELLPKEALPENQENAALQGVPININDTGRKY
jgi:hypothetical protein